MHRLHNVYSLDPLDREHPHAQGLVGMWKAMPWSGGTRWYDLSGHGNHGTLTGYTAGQQSWYAGRDGLGAMSFDGVNDYVGVPHDATLSSQSITVSMWIYPTSFSSFRVIAAKGNNVSSPREWMVLTDTSGKILFSLYNGAYRQQTSTAASTLNQWNFVCATRTANETTITINSVSQSWAETFPIVEGTDSVAIGSANAGGLPFIGLIDDVRIYNRAIFADEIGAQHEDTLTGRYELLRRVNRNAFWSVAASAAAAKFPLPIWLSGTYNGAL